MSMMWEKVRLDDICDLITCGVAKRPDYTESGIPFLSSQNVKENKIILNSYKFISEASHYELTKHNKPQKGDILYTRVGSFGEAAVVNLDFEFSVFVSLTLIKPKIDIIDSRFLMWYLNSPTVRDFASNNTSGIGVQNLNVGVVREYKVPLPPLPIQKRIAEILDTADALRRKDEALLKKYDELAQAIFIDMFGDPVKNEKGWEVKKLGDIVESFKYGTNLKSNDDITGTPVLRIPNIIGNTINLKDLKYSQLSSQELKTTQLQIGDLLFVRSNGNPNYIGRSALFLNQGAFSYASYLIRARLKSQSVYVANYIQFALSYETYRPIILKKATTTAGNYNINTESLKSLLLPIPEEHLLKSFFTKLEICIALKEKKNSSDKSENLFNSLLQKAFNGELVA